MEFFFGYVMPVVFAFIFGSMVGSFANVCIYRMPISMSLMHPASHCPNCARLVGKYNIPILGYFLVRGRCRHCGEPISIRYPLIEFLMAASFAALYYYLMLVRYEHLAFEQSFPLWLVYVGLLAVLFIGSLIDIDHHIIPDEITLGGMVLAPIISVIVPRLHSPLLDSTFLHAHARLSALFSSLVGIAVGMAFIGLIGVLGTLVFRKEAMGLGDVKLMGMIGGLLGWKGALAVPILGSFFSLLFCALVFIRRRGGVIPFGPGLAAGAIAYVILDKYVNIIVDMYSEVFRELVGLI